MGWIGLGDRRNDYFNPLKAPINIILAPDLILSRGTWRGGLSRLAEMPEGFRHGGGEGLGSVSTPGEVFIGFGRNVGPFRVGPRVTASSVGLLGRFRRNTGEYPGELGKPFTGSFEALTAEIKKEYSAFNGFIHSPDLEKRLGTGTMGFWNETTKQIEFATPLHQTARGIVAEEVRHALDTAGGLKVNAMIDAFLVENNGKFLTEYHIGNAYDWHHRRVLTRMMQDADRGHSVMGQIIGKKDVDLLYEFYRSRFGGTKDKTWLLQQQFDNFYRLTPRVTAPLTPRVTAPVTPQCPTDTK